MKNYRQLIRELPSKSVTVAFGNFDIPTAKHESFIKVSKKIAESRSADHIVYVSDDKNILAERKDHYLNLLFPHTKFVHSESTIPFVIENLSKKYKSITVVVSEDKRQAFLRHLKSFDNVNLVSITESDVDADLTKVKSYVTKGQYQLFKESLPTQVRDIDGKLLMNELREGLGLEPIKEQIKFTVDELREKYFRKEIFNIGQFVESAGETFEIVDRGTNYVTVVNEHGETSKKWIQDCQLAEAPVITERVKSADLPPELTYKGYTTKNFHFCDDCIRSFQDTIDRQGMHDPIAVLNAIKFTDQYMDMNNHALHAEIKPSHEQLARWRDAHAKARMALHRIGEFPEHEEYWYRHENELANYGYAERVDPMDESIDSRVTIDPKSGYNGAKDVLRYSDFKKLLKMNKGEVKEETAEESVNPTDLLPNGQKLRIKDLENTGSWANEVGHALGHGDDSQLRRRKAVYHREETEQEGEEIQEDLYTSEYKLSHRVDPETHQVKVVKVRPHRIDFKNSKAHSKPAQDDAQGDVREDEKKDEFKKKYPIKGDALGGGARNKGFDAFFKEELTLEQALMAYNEEEFALVDAEGNEVGTIAHSKTLPILENARTKMQFIEAETSLALRLESSPAMINARARILAQEMGDVYQPLESDKIAMKLAPQIKKIEKDQLVHKKFTK